MDASVTLVCRKNWDAKEAEDIYFAYQVFQSYSTRHGNESLCNLQLKFMNKK